MPVQKLEPNQVWPPLETTEKLDFNFYVIEIMCLNISEFYYVNSEGVLLTRTIYYVNNMLKYIWRPLNNISLIGSKLD